MSKRILVVDDEPHVTRLVKQKLSGAGYEATSATNGLAAIEMVENHGPFDAIVTDYNMPKMDGRQLCEAVRGRYPEAKIQIYLVTARLEGPLRSWAECMNDVEFIEKPLSMRDLLGRLEKLFTTRESAPEGTRKEEATDG